MYCLLVLRAVVIKYWIKESSGPTIIMTMPGASYIIIAINKFAFLKVIFYRAVIFM